MDCAICGGNSKVIDSRPCDAGKGHRRRRECMACNDRWFTVESYSFDSRPSIKVENEPEIIWFKDDREKNELGNLKRLKERASRLESRMVKLFLEGKHGASLIEKEKLDEVELKIKQCSKSED